MASYYYKGRIFDDTTVSRTGAFVAHGHITRQREPEDLFFNTQIEIVSTDTGIAYAVYDKDDALYQQGFNAELETTLPGIVAFSDSDAVKSYHLKYGFNYIAATFVLRRNTSLVFLPMASNANVALSESAASALTGISVNKVSKEVTISEARTQSELYDHLQWHQSQSANTDLLQDGEIFQFISGSSYSIANGWKLVFTAAPSGGWDILSGDIILGALVNLTDFNTAGTLFFDVGGTFTFADSNINAVDTIDGDETVTIEIAGITAIGGNLDPVNITVNTSFLLTINCPTGGVLELFDNDDGPADFQDRGTLLQSTNPTTGADVTYTHNKGGDDIIVSFIKTGFKEIDVPFNLTSSDQSLDLNQFLEIEDNI